VDDKSSRPTLIAHGGFDSTLEELYTFAAAPALERGYNCLTFEGPGQGEVIRTQQIPFKYDWEKVVTPIVDYALTRPDEVDPKRIALMGFSMGGYLAARPAAFEHRIGACILNDGVFDGYDAFASSFPKSLVTAINNGNSEIVNTVLEILSESDPNTRFNIKHGMLTAGVNTPFELIQGFEVYRLTSCDNYQYYCPLVPFSNAFAASFCLAFTSLIFLVSAFTMHILDLIALVIAVLIFDFVLVFLCLFLKWG